MTPQTSFCGKCGKPLAEPDDRFCRSCGAAIEAGPPEASTGPAMPAPAAIAIEGEPAAEAAHGFDPGVTQEPVGAAPQCPRCGTERVGARPYCVKCGLKWADGTPSGPPAPTGSGSGCVKWVLVVGGVVVALFVVLGIIGSVTGSKEKNGIGQAAGVAGTRTPTAIPPTLTAEQVAYTQAVATSENQARLDREATVAAQPTSTPVRPQYELALLARSCTTQADINFTTCEGSVKNLTGSAMAHVEAVVEWSTGAPGTTFVAQSSDDALISYDPLLPGQESPWKVIST
jgi:hypothetical protein